MKTIFAVLILFLISVSAAAQTVDLSALAKSESGKRVLAYFAAFNSGDDQKLRDFFTENVATDSFEFDKMPVNSAEGYTKRNPSGKWTNNLRTRPARGSAARGGYSTAEDLLKFSLALQSRKLNLPDDNGQPPKDVMNGIAGGADGINALLPVNGQTGYTIIVLSNYDPPSAEKPARRFVIG